MGETALKKVAKKKPDLSLEKVGRRRVAVAVDEDLEREDTLEIQAFRKILLKGGEFRGARGLRGEPGETGETGRRGRRGLRGDTGEPGEIGLTGKSVVGPVGVPGVDGVPGEHGRQGEPGSPGPKGDKGDTGPAPRHKWEGTVLSFEQPNGQFGRAVNLQGPAGGRGGAGRSANNGYSEIILNGANLEFNRNKAGPLGPDQSVDLSGLAGGGLSVSIADFGIGEKFYLTQRLTTAPVSRINVVLQGSGGQSVTWELRKASSLSAAGVVIHTATTTSITTGDTITVITLPAILVNDHVWFEFAAVAGTLIAFNATVSF